MYLFYLFIISEEESSVKVLKPGISSQYNISVTSLILGVSTIPRDSIVYQSGYQVLRLATETFPAALAVEGVRNISSFWSICFYTAMILFGFGQQVSLVLIITSFYHPHAFRFVFYNVFPLAQSWFYS